MPVRVPCCICGLANTWTWSGTVSLKLMLMCEEWAVCQGVDDGGGNFMALGLLYLQMFLGLLLVLLVVKVAT